MRERKTGSTWRREGREDSINVNTIDK